MANLTGLRQAIFRRRICHFTGMSFGDLVSPPTNDPRSRAFREAQSRHAQQMAERGYTMIRKADPPTLRSDEDVARAAVRADRERMSAILASPEARQAPLLASELAFNSDQSAQSAIDILKAAVAPLQGQTTSPSAPAAASAEDVAAGWDDAVDRVNEQTARYDRRAVAPHHTVGAQLSPDAGDGDGWDEAIDALNGGRR